MRTGDPNLAGGEKSKGELAAEYLQKIKDFLESPEVLVLLTRYNAIKNSIVERCKDAKSLQDAANQIREVVIESVGEYDIQEIQAVIGNPSAIQAFMVKKGEQGDPEVITNESFGSINAKAITVETLLNSLALAYVLKDLTPEQRRDLLGRAVEARTSSSTLVGLQFNPERLLADLPILSNKDLTTLKENAANFHQAMRVGREFIQLWEDQAIRERASEFEHRYGGGPQYLVTRVASGESLDYEKINDLYKWLPQVISKDMSPEKIEYAEKLLADYYINVFGTEEAKARENAKASIKRALDKS